MPDRPAANGGDDHGGARPWEPWEARRARLPARLPPEVQEARRDARLLIRVVRAWLREGRLPTEYGAELGRTTSDPRLSVRQRRVAASLLAEIRMAAVARVTRSDAGAAQA